MRGQHAIDIGELEENRRRLRDLAAKINHLEEANSELDERAKGLSKDMDTRSEQEKLEVNPSFERINKTSSSWLNRALRDDEAVYWANKRHYEPVAVSNS